MKLKTCTKCNEDKEPSYFSFRNKKKGILRSWCKVCVKNYDKELYNTDPYRRVSIRLRAKSMMLDSFKFIDRYKRWQCCAICGDNRHYVLDFHHLSDKKYIFLSFSIRKCIIKIKYSY